MYITEINQYATYGRADTEHASNVGGIRFNTLDDAANAIVTLGVMQDEDPAEVAHLVHKMLRCVRSGTGVSPMGVAFVQKAVRHGQVPPQPLDQAGGFFWHNQWPATGQSPFRKLCINVHRPRDGWSGDECVLVVQNEVRHPGGLHHTESELARALGIKRPIVAVELNAEVPPSGPQMQFNIAGVVRALQHVSAGEWFQLPDELGQHFLDHKGKLDGSMMVTTPVREMEVTWGPFGWNDENRKGIGVEAGILTVNGYEDADIKPRLEFRITPGSKTEMEVLELATDLEAALFANNY